MSYILDALKKAERERSVARVPNLETIHSVPERSRAGLWIASAVLLLAAVTGIFVLLDEDRGRSDGDVSKNRAAATEAADPATTGAAIPSPLSFPSSSAGPGSGAAAGIPNAADAVTAREDTSPKPRPIAGPESLDQPRRPEPSRISGEASLSAQSPPPAAPMAQNTGNLPGTKDLQEVIQGMEISIHLYSDTPANRMIFINGRKYIEGDRIEGLYLIESITPEGAVLSYRGAEASIKAAP